MDLPSLSLSESPARHAECCLSLSTKLFDTLIEVFTTGANTPSTVLSIGSGSGFLEAALNTYTTSSQANLTIQGVEVQQSDAQPPVNKYLPEQYHHTVRGTRDLSTQLGDDGVVGLMFVFPRQPDLVSRYIDAARNGNAGVKSIVWLGPAADWEDFSRCFEHHAAGGGSPPQVDIRRGEAAGLAEYEMTAILRV